MDTLRDRLRPGQQWRKLAIDALVRRSGEPDLLGRLDNLRATARRMDSRYDAGFILADEYFADRAVVQQDIDRLSRLLIVSDELEHAADVLNDFDRHWQTCNGDVERQNELLKQILCWVYVRDNTHVFLDFQPDYQLLIDIQITASSGAVRHGSQIVPGEKPTRLALIIRKAA